MRHSPNPHRVDASVSAQRPSAAAAAWIALLVAVALAMLTPAVQAATYKWVDEKGVTHYTDKIPTEAVNKGSTILDKQARPVKRIDPALTPEQVRAREAEDEQRRLTARQTEEIARRDRALISSYTTESEIDLARSRALGTLDAQIESAQAYSVQLNRRKEELDKRRAALGSKPMPAALEREIEGTDDELEKTARLLEQKQKERVAVVARYDSDKARWRELKSIADANAAAAAAAATKPHPATLPPTAAGRK